MMRATRLGVTAETRFALVYATPGFGDAAPAAKSGFCYGVTVLGTVDQNGPERDQKGVLQV